MPKTMERKTILTYEDFRLLARPTSSHIDREDVMTYIQECEDEKIIPVFGWRYYKAATGIDGAWDECLKDTFRPDVLLNGGEWEEIIINNGIKTIKLYYTNGLKKAIAYFVYAKLLRADGTIVSRSGAMRHRSDESDHVDDSKLRQYNDTMSLAEMYLSESLNYLHNHTRKKMPIARGTRARIHSIGR